MAFQDYQWIGGFDNTGTLVNIESDIPEYQGIVTATAGLGSYDPGIITPRLDRSTITRGYQFVEWTFSALEIAQYAYIQSTYTVGGNSHYAKMTIKTPIEDGTFTSYNAHLYLPPQSSLSRTSQAFTNLVIRFGLDGLAA